MIISDLNHLETISETHHIEGGFSRKNFSPTTQVNLALIGQSATSAAVGFFAGSSAYNSAGVYQVNMA